GLRTQHSFPTRRSSDLPVATGSAKELQAALAGRTVVIAAGAAGAVLLPHSARAACPGLNVAIDLNAVPPLGIEGVEVTDKAAERSEEHTSELQSRGHLV